MLAPKTVYPMYMIHSIEMVKMKYMGTDRAKRVALISPKYELIPELKDMFHVPGQCYGSPEVHSTSYEKIEIIIGKHVSAVLKEVKPFILDSRLSIQILHDYANYHVENSVVPEIQI